MLESVSPFVDQNLSKKSFLGSRKRAKMGHLLLQHVSRLKSRLEYEEINQKGVLPSLTGGSDVLSLCKSDVCSNKSLIHMCVDPKDSSGP